MIYRMGYKIAIEQYHYVKSLLHGCQIPSLPQDPSQHDTAIKTPKMTTNGPHLTGSLSPKETDTKQEVFLDGHVLDG